MTTSTNIANTSASYCVGLDLLAAELPRTFVVLLSPIDVALVSQLQDKGLVCEVAHKYECPCVFQNRGRGIKRVRWLHKQYKWADSIADTTYN